VDPASETADPRRLDSVFAATVQYGLVGTLSCQCRVKRLQLRLIHRVRADLMHNSASYATISGCFLRPRIKLLGFKQKQQAGRHYRVLTSSAYMRLYARFPTRRKRRFVFDTRCCSILVSREQGRGQAHSDRTNRGAATLIPQPCNGPASTPTCNIACG
jgi:hypothetical protein